MKELSTESYKGVRDFYPEDYAIQDFIFAVMRSTVESFGYEEYSASILEPAELYEAKSSQEIIDEQTYTFTDRGERRVTLRPEMTPTVARMVAARRKSTAFPLRWYSIPNLFRYERPQKGRLREHFQLNVDLFGDGNIHSDLEILHLAHTLMKNFGLIDGQFVIRLNDRKDIDALFNTMNLDEEKIIDLKRLIDRKDKIETFEQDAEALIGKPLIIDTTPSPYIQSLIEKLKSLGITNVVFDPYLMRGFDYYTGMVFEVFDTSGENTRSLFGGGRYDNLLDIFGEEKIPAVGFGMGDVTIKDVLTTYNLLPEATSLTDLYICVEGKESMDYAQTLGSELRDSGVNVIVDTSEKKLASQIEYADKKGIGFALCIGSNETQSHSYILKNLATKEDTAVTKENIFDTLFPTLN